MLPAQRFPNIVGQQLRLLFCSGCFFKLHASMYTSPPGRKGRLRDYLLTLIFFSLAAGLATYLSKQNAETKEGIIYAVDGDSIRVSGKRIRLRGIDAPEGKQHCGKSGEEWPCGFESRKFLRNLTKQKQVTCDGDEYDRYNRLLAVCTVDGLDINREIVAKGWAVALGDYEREEAIARRDKRGIWRSEFLPPQEWRKLEGEESDPNEGKGILQILFGRED